MKSLLLRFPAVRDFLFERGVKREITAGEYRPTITPMHILDLGAHKGFATCWFAKQYPNVIIHSYEPNPKLFPTLLQRTRNLPNVKVFREAIGTKDGMVDFHIADNALSSSVFGHGRTTSVACVSLGTAVGRIEGESIFVKMDIEGAEYDVLRAIPLQIHEIIGEAHPKKANRSNDELRGALSRFKQVSVGEGTSLFHAV